MSLLHRRSGRETSRFGGCRVAKLIHEGQKSLIYKAKAAGTDETCVVKLYVKEFDKVSRRLRARYNLRSEGEIGLVLNPPEGGVPGVRHHVVATLGYGNEFESEENPYYVVLEYVDGYNMKNLMNLGHPSLRRRRVSLASQMCDGLLHIHNKGLIHRDFCSDNVLLRRDGCVKIIDLGFAAPVGVKFEEKTGTISYISPEQIRGAALDVTCDIYSFGVVLFELFVGRLPFIIEPRTGRADIDSRRATKMMQKHMHDAPPTPRSIAPDVPEVVEKIIMRCLQKEPGERYRSLREIRMMLSELEER